MYNYFKNDEKSQVIRLFIAVLMAIFAVEFGIMLIIYFIQPSLPFLVISIIDSVVLVLIVFPMIYLLNYRPLLVQINERKQAEEGLKNYATKLEEANRLKDLFADIMHHDLLNPLGNIKLASETLLCAENMDKGMSDGLFMIKRNADRLIEMTRSAGTYARLESAEKLERSNHDLNEMFKTAANNFKSLLDEKNMMLDYQPKGRCCAMVNPVFEDVFSNLLSNAIKYSPAGNKIEVSIKEEKENCRFYIKDWGPGIKEEDKAKLFVRFQRVDKGGVKGTGLGLAIVKRIVELHGGRVWIEDNPEGGSMFYVEIPKA